MAVSLLRMMEQYDPALAHHIVAFEDITNRNSEDIRLDQEIQMYVQSRIIDLGLDPTDTTTKELYHSLCAKFLSDDKSLIGRNILDVFGEHLKKSNRTAWTLKAPALKKMIKANPPKNLISQLGYRSIDSMLKREKPGELLLAAEQVEPAAWRSKILAAFKKLKPADFGPSTIECVISNEPRWQKIAGKLIEHQGHSVLVSWITGTIFVITPPDIQGARLANVLSMQRAVDNILVHSSLLRFVQVSKKFSTHLSELLTDKLKIFALSNRTISWAEITKILAGIDEDSLQDRFGLHIAPEDFEQFNGLEKLIESYPSLNFWSGHAEYSVFQEDIGQPFVSFHPQDLITNILPVKKTHEKATAVHGLATMEQELLQRYAHHDVLKAQLLLQLDHL